VELILRPESTFCIALLEISARAREEFSGRRARQYQKSFSLCRSRGVVGIVLKDDSQIFNTPISGLLAIVLAFLDIHRYSEHL
jgi:hypothetical protein